MKKPFRLIIDICLTGTLISFMSCGKVPGGIYSFSEDARNYQFDTVNSFMMVDNHGITEAFYIDNYAWYARHHEFAQFGDLYLETFGVAYHSVLNDYFFIYLLRAEEDYSGLSFEWNQKDRLLYNFDIKKVMSDIIPAVRFYDTLSVKGAIYNHIIEIDYSDVADKIDANTPVMFFISGDKGLIKFIRKDGVISERIPE